MLRGFVLFAVMAIAISLPATAQQQDPEALNREVMALYRKGNYGDALDLARDALVAAVRKYGNKHPTVATALHNRGVLYEAYRLLKDAEQSYKRSLEIREKALGSDHLDVGTTLNRLAIVYYRQGRYAEATHLLQRAVAVLEKQLGAHHPDVGYSLTNLAALYRRQGRMAQVEPLYKRSIAISEKAKGPNHPDVATPLNNLAGFYKELGRSAEAESLYRRSLSIRARALGAQHSDVGQSLGNLAVFYHQLGRHAEAEPLYRRALDIRKRSLGADDIAVALTLNSLGMLYDSQGRYDKAEQLLKRAFAIYEKALGPDHAKVADVRNNLAGLYYGRGRYAEAEPLFSRSLADRQKALGFNHPDVGANLGYLGMVYAAQGRALEAEQLYKRSLSVRQRALGPQHSDVTISLTMLANLYIRQGRYAEAEELHKRSLVIRKATLGPDHPATGVTLEGLVRLYKAMRRPTDAAKAQELLDQMPKQGTRHLPVYFATMRSPGSAADRRTNASTALFGAKPNNLLSFGRWVMQVPESAIKRLAQDRADNLGRLDRGRDKLTAVDVFKPVRRQLMNQSSFAGSLHAQMRRAALAKNQALIFVHGFNVDFEDSIRRLSQVAFDLEFDGALIAFSWPSLGNPGPASYWVDTKRADASVEHFVRFLDQISQDMPSVTFHVMAHSMGSRILTRALHQIALRPQGVKRPKLGEIILAHADVAPQWCEKLGRARPYVRGIVNYANRDDAALRVSSIMRAGQDRCGLNPKSYKGIDTVDTTGMGGKRTSLFSVMFGAKNHHGVFANDPLLFGEISRVITSGQRPVNKRTPEFAQRQDGEGGMFWAYDASRDVTTEFAESRSD